MKKRGGYYHYFIDEGQICYVFGEGSVNYKTLITEMSNVVLDTSFSKEMLLIIDLREVEYHPSYKEIMGIKDHLQFLKEHFQNKIALITNEQLYYVAHLICSLANVSSMQMKAFRKLGNARIWLSPK